MSVREYIADIFENKYLLAKIQSLATVKGIESDLRFLFEQSFFSRTGKLPETEVENRIDLKLPLDPQLLIEMKCYDGVLSVTDTQDKIKKDLSTLSKRNSSSKKLFLYFGLYGRTQPPVFKETFVPSKRIDEIKSEIEKIHGLAKDKGIDITSHEYYDKSLPDRILYVAWFHLNWDNKTAEQPNQPDAE